MDLAEKEPCVIIGRNADYILKDRDDVMNVFIHGNMPEKIQRITRLYNVEEKEAVKMMADTDKRRMTNYNFYTDQKWGKADNYTLCLNSSQQRKFSFLFGLAYFFVTNVTISDIIKTYKRK